MGIVLTRATGADCAELHSLQIAAFADMLRRYQEHQNKGYAQEAIRSIGALYCDARGWELDTIQQEARLCYLYEKMGYRRTGKERGLQPGMTLVDYAKETKDKAV